MPVSPYISWSEFDGATDATPKFKTGPLAEFLALFERTHPGKTKKTTSSVCPATFVPNSQRSGDSVQMVYALALDIDHSRPMQTEEDCLDKWGNPTGRKKVRKVRTDRVTTPQEIAALLSDYTYRMHTSWSHTPEWPKFRVILPLEAPITPDIWPAAVEAALQDLGMKTIREMGAIDLPVVMEASRMYFLPASGSITPVQFWANDGRLLNIPVEGLESVRLPALPYVSHKRTKPPGNMLRFGMRLETIQLDQLLRDLGQTLGRPRKLVDGGTKYRCTCPYGEEHTGDPDGDDAYIIMSPGKWPIFGCAHSQHTDVGLEEILQTAQDAGFQIPGEPQDGTLEEKIRGLSRSASINDIHEVLHLIAAALPLEQKTLLNKVKVRTGFSLADLNQELKRYQDKAADDEANDLARRVMEAVVDKKFAGGRHICQTHDKSIWTYNGRFWNVVKNDLTIAKHFQDMIRNIDTKSKGEDHLAREAFSIFMRHTAIERGALRLEADLPEALNCSNGELWFNADGSVTLRQHSAASGFRYVLSMPYDPQATCPTYDRAIADTFAQNGEPQAMVDYWHEICGYVIQPLRNQKVWFLGVGEGNNGKTKQVQTLEKALSKESVLSASIAQINRDQFMQASLVGKLLVKQDDTDADMVLPDGFLKQISEAKELSTRRIRQEEFSFTCTVVPMILSNHFPQIHDLSRATQERVQIIPFRRRFDPKTIANPFPVIWESEMSGVLNRYIQGLQRLRARGFFAPPEECEKEKELFFAEANPIAAFLMACERGEFIISAKELYDSYRDWARQEGHRWNARRNEFERGIQSLGVKISNSSGRREIHGVRYVQEA